MKYFTLLVVSCFLSLALSSSAQQLSQDEQKLYDLVMAYRKSKGLPSIPVSVSLTYVAQTHAKDVVNQKLGDSPCNLHSWSEKGKWTPCCYTSDHKKADCMWSKPNELTSYSSSGYEISAGSYSYSNITPQEALDLWKKSSGHNQVILNQGIWKDNKWNAIGIGIFNGYACIWFGEALDTATSVQLK